MKKRLPKQLQKNTIKDHIWLKKAKNYNSITKMSVCKNTIEDVSKENSDLRKVIPESGGEDRKAPLFFIFENIKEVSSEDVSTGSHCW